MSCFLVEWSEGDARFVVAPNFGEAAFAFVEAVHAECVAQCEANEEPPARGDVFQWIYSIEKLSDAEPIVWAPAPPDRCTCGDAFVAATGAHNVTCPVVQVKP